jgi:hypothetical protein
VRCDGHMRIARPSHRSHVTALPFASPSSLCSVQRPSQIAGLILHANTATRPPLPAPCMVIVSAARLDSSLDFECQRMLQFCCCCCCREGDLLVAAAAGNAAVRSAAVQGRFQSMFPSHGRRPSTRYRRNGTPSGPVNNTPLCGFGYRQ